MLPSGLHTVFKTKLYAKKGSWQSLYLHGVQKYLCGINRKYFQSGNIAIWLSPIFIDTKGIEFSWLILDVEDKQQHQESIAANIEAGRQFLRFLCEHGLDAGLIILLTGNGFRFCWPYLVPKKLQKAFNLWVNDKKNYPWIDPAPFKAKVPMRILGNRNHSNQGTVLNRHVHRLNDIHDLWFMSEDEYLDLVFGTVDLNISCGWLSEILPTQFIPKRWENFLNHYQTIVTLSDSIYSPIIPQNNYQKPVSAIANQAGLEYREHQFAHGGVLKLDVCPICGRKDGNPYITPSGRLKCYHRNTCSAGTVDEHDNIIGLPLSEWMPEAENTYDTEELTDQEQVGQITIDAAREALKKGIAGDDNAFIKQSPGVGKTYTTTKSLVAELESIGKVAIAAPEHKLSSEHYKLARKIARDPESIHCLKGRGVENCSRIAKIQQVADAGFSPGAVVCSSCPEKRDKTCKYWAQFDKLRKDKHGLWLMTHAMSIEVPLSKYGFSLLVMDESPIRAFLQKTVSNVGAMQMIQAKLSSNGRVAMGKLMEVVPKQLKAMQVTGAKQYDLSRIYVGQAPEQSPWSGLSDLWTISGITDEDLRFLESDLSMFNRWVDRGDGKPETMGQWHKRLYYNERIDLTALDWLWSAHAKTRGTYIRFKTDPKNPAQFISFKKRLPEYEGRIICLDATGSRTEVENLFERKFSKITGKIEMSGIRTAWVKQAGGKNKMTRMTDNQINSILKAAATFLQPSDSEVLIATHMAVEETVKRLATEMMPEKKIYTCHYWGGSRGVNEFQDCTAVIALGTPFPNIDGLFDHAMALIPESDARLKWIAEVGTNELVQALHRIRPIRGNRTVIVCGRDFPVKEFGKAQFKMNRQRGNKISDSAISQIVDRLSPFVECWKFMTKEIAWMYKIYQVEDKAKAMQLYEITRNTIHEIKKDGCNPLNLLGESCRDGKGSYLRRVYLLRNILLGKPDLNTFLSLPFTTYTDHSTWNKALEILAEKFSLPKLTVSGQTYNFKKTAGIGYLRDVRAFYENIGKQFEPESWSGIESEEDTK